MRSIIGEIHEKRLYAVVILMINDPFLRKCGPQVTGITFIESLTYFFMVVVYFLWSTVRSFYRIMLVSVTVAHISVKFIKSPIQWMPRPGVAIFTPQSEIGRASCRERGGGGASA